MTHPLGTAGVKIPWSGRGVTIREFFDALTMHRVCSKAFSDGRTLEMMLAGWGRKFDPEMLDVFVTHMGAFVRLREEINVSQTDRRQQVPGWLDGIEGCVSTTLWSHSTCLCLMRGVKRSRLDTIAPAFQS